MNEALTLEILDLLDRNKARRVVKKPVDNNCGSYCCPACGCFLGAMSGEPLTTNYCHNCGQRLEWEDEE